MVDVGLGQRLSRHRGSFLAGGWGWYVGGILLLATGLSSLKLVQALIAGEANLLEQLGGAVCSLGAGALFLIRPVSRLAQSVEVFEHGLVHRRPWGTKTIRREQVAGASQVTQYGRGGAFEVVVIELRDGGRTTLTGISDAAQIVAFARAWASGGAPASSGGGWTPPTSGGGWTPPTSGGGWTPPPSGGGWTPPSS